MPNRIIVEVEPPTVWQDGPYWYAELVLMNRYRCLGNGLTRIEAIRRVCREAEQMLGAEYRVMCPAHA